MFSEYSGSDGLSISQSYDVYLKKCEAFVKKAREYKVEKRKLKESVIHSDFPGYEPCDCHERYALEERNKNLKIYFDTFGITSFISDTDMYENFTGQYMKTRIIRELSRSRTIQCTKSSVDQSLFLRFCALSRFIQAVRMIILKRRLERRLDILKRLKSTILQESVFYPGTNYEGKCDENINLN